MWLVFLFIINCITAKMIYSDSVYDYKCKTDENCVHLVPNSMCFNNKCVCQIGYKSDGMSRCIYELRYRRQINFGKRT